MSHDLTSAGRIKGEETNTTVRVGVRRDHMKKRSIRGGEKIAKSAKREAACRRATRKKGYVGLERREKKMMRGVRSSVRWERPRDLIALKKRES